MISEGGKLRYAVKPNLRKQDGPKLYLLCEECEELFSKTEKIFSETIFTWVLDSNVTSFDYDENLYYFAVSILWRILVNRLRQNSSSRSQNLNLLLTNAEQKWRYYLLNHERGLEDFAEIHLLITDIVEGHPDVKQWNRYLVHNVDATIASSPSECLVYAKFFRFMFFGWISPRDKKRWKNTRINRKGGTFLTRKQTMIDESVNNFIVSRAQSIDACFQKLSPNEEAKIIKFCDDNFDKILNSDLGRAINADYGIDL